MPPHTSPSESSAAPEDKDNRATFLNDDATPQASRQASISGSTDGNSEDKVGQQPAQPAKPAGLGPLNRGVQRTIDETLTPHGNGEDSPVLNETLSVIDEHITNFNTPRHSLAGPDHHNSNDSGSEYSGPIAHRLSYIPGAETDEEEEDEGLITEADVRSWDQKKTAQQLRMMGVESRHCDIFEKEEITGDVLLDMDQEFIYMKEFDFGVMGRRLKTWYKIKGFQEAVRGPKAGRQSASRSASSQHGRNESEEFDRVQSRTTTGGFLPRIPSVNGSHRENVCRSDASMSVEGIPPSRYHQSQAATQMGRHSASRPSADSIRRSSYRRRHSSIDTTTTQSPRQDTRAAPTAAKRPSFQPRRDKPSSFDRTWTMTTGIESLPRRPDTSLGTADDATRTAAWKSNGASTPSTSFAGDSIDGDKGYFSGGEVDSRRSRNLLKKKKGSSNRSASYSRHSSAAGDQAHMTRRHSRFSSLGSRSDVALATGAIQPQHHGHGANHRARDSNTSAMEMVNDDSHSPTVTNLEGNSSPTSRYFPVHRFPKLLSLHPKPKTENPDKTSPAPNLKHVAPKVRRAIGLRTISDAVTGHEKSAASSSASGSPAKESPKSPSTPSRASKGAEPDSTDSSLINADSGLGFLNRGKTSSSRGRSKKDTSAYVRGLEKKSPQEQIAGCDYYGWMKKKSSHLMTTWKSRLFVLRGRRLSYYYSENDTEERGLIDISSHRVFRADQDTITSLHATLTGATSFPTSATHSGGNSDQVSASSSHEDSNSGNAAFIFKLVPPKVGSARGVQFTKPAVHFFQVDSPQQGRLWMAALMKSTIERDLNLPVRTTNKQTTVSLKQARGTNQLPPALQDSGGKESSSENNAKKDGTGIEVPARTSSAGRHSKVDEMTENGSINDVMSVVQLDGLDAASLSLFPEPAPDPDHKT